MQHVRAAALILARRGLTVLGKGCKPHTIPLPHAHVMGCYLFDVRPELPAPDALSAYPRAVRAGAHRGRTDGKTLARVVTRYGQEAQVAGPHLPQRWRDAHATPLLRRGVDVAVVQKLLGHTGIQTTVVHLDRARDDLQAGVDRVFG